MTTRSFFVQRPEDALRHLKILADGLNKLALAGWISGGCSALLALLMGRFLNPHPQPGATGTQEMSGIVLFAWFIAAILLVFSTLYFVAGKGLEQRKNWARNTAAAAFLAKVLLCMWLGRGSLGAMLVLLTIATWDLYGLWVLAAKETGLLFTTTAAEIDSAANPEQTSAKPAA